MRVELEEMERQYSDRRYWEEGLAVGGYDGYWDFPVNAWRLRRILELRGTSVLDVGCAMGFLVKLLREHGKDARGVDISDYALAQAPEEAKPYLTKAWAHALPFPDRSVDLLVSFGVVEHLPPELVGPTIAEFRRVARRGLVAATLSTSKGTRAGGGPDKEGHLSLRTYAWWRERLPPEFELWADDNEAWLGYYSGNATIVAPTVYPVSAGGRYGGVERLAGLFAKGLARRGFKTDVVAARGSTLPPGARLVDAGPPMNDFREPGLVPALSLSVTHRQTFPVLDFSHSHPVIQWPSLPSISVAWHDPAIMQPVLPKRNVAALSRWQAERLRKYQAVQARVLDPICADERFYSFGAEPEDRYLYIGKLHPTKGALETARMCRAVGAELDIVGPVTPGDPPQYAEAVKAECDGDQIVYHGEVGEEAKLALLQRSKALLYPVSYPPGTGEAHSHKMVESFLCGTPCITYRHGAMAEVVEDGVTGYCVHSPLEFQEAMKWVEAIDRLQCRRRALERWSLPAVMARWLPVMRDVCRGDRW